MNGKLMKSVILTVIALQATMAPASAQAPIVTLTADRTTLTAGQCATIALHITGSWTRYQSDSLGLLNSNQYNSPDYQIKKQVCPGSTTRYLATVYYNGGNVVTQLTITVSSPSAQPNQPPPPQSQANQFTLTADQTSLAPGQCTTIRWHTSNGVFLNYNSKQAWELVPGFANPRIADGSMQECPSSTTTYSVYVRFADHRTETKSIKISVSTPPPPQPPPQQPVQPPQPVQPQPPPQPPPNSGTATVSVSFYASPDTINAGQCTTLYWHVVGNDPKYTGATIQLEDSATIAGVPDDSRRECPRATFTYTLYGKDIRGNAWERDVTVTVVQPANPPELAIRADSHTITRGECTTIHWAVAYVQWFNINGLQVSNPGEMRDCPQKTTTYTLSAGAAGYADQARSVTVSVLEPRAPSINFYADPPIITLPACSTLRWDVSDARSVYWGSQERGFQDHERVCPKSSTAYQLSVTTLSGESVLKIAAVSVRQAPAEPAEEQPPAQQQQPVQLQPIAPVTAAPISAPEVLGIQAPPVSKQPSPLPALRDITIGKLLERLTLGQLMDTWDLVHGAPEYHRKLDKAEQAEVDAFLKYGQGSPQEISAKEHVAQVRYFEMPFLGPYFELFVWAANKVAQPIQ